jgi:hypothetical protein
MEISVTTKTKPFGMENGESLPFGPVMTKGFTVPGARLAVICVEVVMIVFLSGLAG